VGCFRLGRVLVGLFCGTEPEFLSGAGRPHRGHSAAATAGARWSCHEMRRHRLTHSSKRKIVLDTPRPRSPHHQARRSLSSRETLQTDTTPCLGQEGRLMCWPAIGGEEVSSVNSVPTRSLAVRGSRTPE